MFLGLRWPSFRALQATPHPHPPMTHLEAPSQGRVCKPREPPPPNKSEVALKTSRWVLEWTWVKVLK